MYFQLQQLVFYILFSFFISIKVSGQCTPTKTYYDYANLRTELYPVCSDQFTDKMTGGGIFKVVVKYISQGDTFRFSTVYETTDDTVITLYDASGTQLATNDDDTDCDCKQSLLTYTHPIGSLQVIDGYIIVSKPGCAPLVSDVVVQYSVRNESNTPPKITSPKNLTNLCIGAAIEFTAENFETSTSQIWDSFTPDILTIDKVTGKGTILKGGIAEIELLGLLTCKVRKKYFINAPVTSVISVN